MNNTLKGPGHEKVLRALGQAGYIVGPAVFKGGKCRRVINKRGRGHG